jgi:molybdopterin-guanine dinucleotide biosynthesis protein A
VPDQIETTNLYGIIVCGGASSRMGTDKSMLVYHDKSQCYHLYEMLLPFCEKVFISCNESQVIQFEPSYSTMPDLPVYNNIGPMAALLTAFKRFPGKDILAIGCDYPFLTGVDLINFLNSFKKTVTAAAFYNSAVKLYEPLLAYYNHRSMEAIIKMYANKEYSLQHFLKINNAFKFYPGNLKTIESIDTAGEFLLATKSIKKG